MPADPGEHGYTAAQCLDDGAEDESPLTGPKAQENARLGAAKAASVLMKIENQGYIGVPTDSTYGATIAIPQIARSSGWSTTYTGLCIRVYVFHSVTFFMQAFLLTMVRQETHTMDAFSGKMHLCDFGKNIDNCPHGPNCRGPGGTNFTYPRLYDFKSWNIRTFVRDSMLAVFPDKRHEIAKGVDPGEWGIENHYCRLACLFIFMMSVVEDLRCSFSLLWLLWSAPSRPEMWITYEVPDWGDKAYVKKVRSWGELDLVKFKIAGMPLQWKMLNLVIVVVPKLFIWVNLCSTGFHFLMETSSIVDVIVNAVALKFILDLDEMILDHLCSSATRYIMKNLEPIQLFDTSEDEAADETEAKERFGKQEAEISGKGVFQLLFPKRLCFILLLMFIFMFKYYYQNCNLEADGSLVSKPMYVLGDHTRDSVIELLLGWFRRRGGEPFWKMPGSNG